MSSREETLRQLLQPTVEALGFELWGVEHLSQGRHSVLRLYIDRDAGISVDDCALVSAQVGSVLDVEDPIAGDYTLEVSSPGLDRRLFSLPQYDRFSGEAVDVRLRTPYEGQRRFRGVLKGIEGEDVVVQVEDHEYLLPFDQIDKARVELKA
ncbi:ribosome maturation factor RimP [Chromatocurvus halotolerans]|uniref:Ribosome maturation factor RimP n=1 Tax=Chromatocurvus halotolerans TaxID=1132028 RepID=A0A4R2KV94_9GAMM|nr:ribosome maturation factor RimP [Chromatocurvus halotolerans]TCO75089.1 ribosome maturation factor RimP [Chromatocurvus halotolerans]